MRQILFPRQPLARSTLVACHLVLQLGLVAAALLLLTPRTPWFAPLGWGQALPTLALGTGIWLLAAIGLRLLAELCLLLHHLTAMRSGFTASSVVNRSFERRPAVHSREASWTSESGPLEEKDDAVGKARVTRPAQRWRPRGASNEPSVDLAGDPEALAPHWEPRL